MIKDDEYELRTWINLYLHSNRLTFDYQNEYVYVRKSGEALLTFNRADGSIKLFTDEIDYNVLKGIMKIL